MSATGSRGAWSETHHAGVMVPPPRPHFRSLAEQVEWESHEAEMSKPLTERELEEDEEEAE